MKPNQALLGIVSLAALFSVFFIWNANDLAQARAQAKTSASNTTNSSYVERLAASSRLVGGRALRARGDAAQDETVANELSQIFELTDAAFARVGDREESAAQRRQIKLEWTREIERFLQKYPGSPYDADLNIRLGQAANVRSAYAKAISYYARAWDATKNSAEEPSPTIAREAAGELAKLLAATGKLDLLDELENELRQRNKPPVGRGWWWALEVRQIARANPADYYKCGLWCLDKLGRVTQPGGFNSREVVETESSPNGFTALELLDVAARAGVNVNTVFVTDWTRLPVPTVLHLTSEHFVVVTEKRGDFYGVNDPLLGTMRWLTVDELKDEASGCILVHQNLVGSVGTRVLQREEAAVFRGRCHGPLPGDHEDPGPCTNDEDEDSDENKPVKNPDADNKPEKNPNAGNKPEINPDATGNKPVENPGGGGGPALGSGGGIQGKPETCCGMIELKVSQPYLNAWLLDTPLVYQPGNGPQVRLHLAYTARRDVTGISGEYHHGSSPGLSWGGSWFSWGELSDDGNSAEVLLPSGAFAVFTFSGSSTSDVSYRQNLKLEKISSGGSVTALKLLYPSGKIVEYARKVDPQAGYYIYFMTKDYDLAGNYTTFSYNASDLVTTVTASDGVTFTLAYDGTYTDVVTNIVASYGPTVALLHGESDMGDGQYSPWANALTTLIDPVNITSRIGYWFFETPYRLVTPYGTTEFDAFGHTNNTYIGLRHLRITHPNAAQEFYLAINESPFTDWPAFSSEIPSGVPVGTLDTAERTNRNTIHWGIRQFEGLESTDFENLTWVDFKRGRIRHWLANTAPIYTHFDTLSWEQDPSPDGGTTAGQVTWYDYTGKGSYAYERGSQIRPSDIATVMPDGTTWYSHFTRNSIGKPTQKIEKWVHNGTANYRTNSWIYSTDGVDLVEHRFGPSGGDRRIIGYGYSGLHPHLPTQITNSLGWVTTITYDNTHRMVTFTTPAGLVISNTFGGDGFLSKSVDYESGIGPIRTNEFTWSNGLVITRTDSRGAKITNTWDYLRRLTEVKYPDGSTEIYAYTNGAGVMTLDLTFYQSPLGAGFTNTAEYNCFRKPIYQYDALGRITAFGYCDCGALTTITNAYGALNETNYFVYDNRGHLLHRYFPDGTALTNAFDLLGRLTTVTDALGATTNYYDNLNRLVLASNAFGLVQGIAYDNEDRVSVTTNANGVVINYAYDDIDRIITRTYPDSGVETFGYTANVLGATSYTNQLSKVTTWGYDKNGRLTNETVVGLATNLFSFSPANDLLTLSDGKSQVTTWGYTIYGQVASKMYANNTTNLVYEYDAAGRLTNRNSTAKGDTKYKYDAVGNLTNINYNASPDVTFTYDALNRSTTEAVSGLFTSTFTYHPGGALKTEDGPFASDTITYYTNMAGLRSGYSLQQPTGSFTNGYSYDSAGRMNSIASTAGSFTYDYYPMNGGVASPTRLIRKIILPSSAYITNTFDNNARQTRTTLFTGGNVEMNDHAYLYNVGNKRTQQTYTDDAYVTYSYDDAGQLRTAYTTNSSGSEITAQRYMYGYDAAWNMLKRTNNASVTTYTVNNLNQNTAFNYDSNGNPTSQNPTSYTYDDENRLISYIPYMATRVDFYYDARGRLRKRVDSPYNAPSSEVRYVYDGMLVIQERTSANAPTVTYTRGPDLGGSMQGAGGIGGLLARSTGYSSGTGAWSAHANYHADANGNITYLIKSDQTVGATYRYDPFGRTITSSGTLASANTYRFSSKELILNTGHYYYGYRFYDPNAQRWMNRDPLGESGDVNLYRFGFNNAINEIDPFGDCPLVAVAVPIIIEGFTIAAPPVAALVTTALGSTVAIITVTRDPVSPYVAPPEGLSILNAPPDLIIEYKNDSGRPNIAKRSWSKTRKEAEQKARRAGKGNPPVNHPNHPGQPPHFHQGDGKGRPANHDHYYYPRRYR